MFGQSDNKTQTNNPSPADTAPPMPANPFGDNDIPVPAPPAPESVVAPSAPLPSDPVSTAVAASPSPAAEQVLSIAAGPTPVLPNSAGSDDLLNLKQQALQSLQPLVSHLDQSPEEKFKTTMMLIQASDNPALVKQAYEAASQIADEKARAQALLDVVNEINYFTHKEEK